MDATSTSKVSCSFCEKTQDNVAALIASPIEVLPRVYICDECVGVCQSILEDHHRRTAEMRENNPQS
jgi:ATP-dependent Clp protease ATP-binding subunit ClpX